MQTTLTQKSHSVDIPLSLNLSPNGHLYLQIDSTDELLPTSIAEKISSFFNVSESVALLRLGLSNFNVLLPPSFAFWQQFSKTFIT